jgi:hypothetical protein
MESEARRLVLHVYCFARNINYVHVFIKMMMFHCATETDIATEKLKRYKALGS